MYHKIQCIGLNVARSRDGTGFDPLERITGAMDALADSLAGKDTLKIFLAPVGFMAPTDQPLQYAAYADFIRQAAGLFARPRFKHWLLVPGTLCYRDDRTLFHTATCFLGGAEVSCRVLQQTFSPHQGLAQIHNAVHCLPRDIRVLSAMPAEKVDFFRPETGLRLGVEIDNDHFDGLLWSAFAEDAHVLPDLQLVPGHRRPLTDSENRIPGNTAAIRRNGLLFGCHDGLHEPGAQLFRYLGNGMFESIQPTIVLTGSGTAYRFPDLTL